MIRTFVFILFCTNWLLTLGMVYVTIRVHFGTRSQNASRNRVAPPKEVLLLPRSIILTIPALRARDAWRSGLW